MPRADMTPLRALAITACALALHALIVPRGLCWDLGETIRERGERRVGADVTQRFLTEDGQLLAPEVTYRAVSPWTTLLSVEPAACDIRPTGHLRVVTLPPLKRPAKKLPHGVRTTVGERWEGNSQPAAKQALPRLFYHTSADSARWLGCAERQRQEDYYLYAAAAAPVDYLVDPVLTAVSTPLILWFGGCFIVGVSLYVCF